MDPKGKAILVLTAAIAFASSPFWSGGFAGFRPEQFPIPQIDPPIQPAGYAFSIWGLIYIWLIASAGFGLLQRDTDPDWDRVRWPLFLSLAIGASWISVAQLSPIWATVLIWAMLIAALFALRATPTKDRWLLQAPIAIYAGWLTAASSVSIGLVGAGYDLIMGQMLWAYVALGLAFALAIATQLRVAHAPEYGATVIWALVALAAQNIALGNIALVAASLGAAVVIAGTAFRAARR